MFTKLILASSALLATSAAAQSADQLPSVQVALAPEADPQPRLTALLGQLQSRRAHLESEGMRSIQAAFDQAITSAKGQVDAVCHHSFLQVRGPSVRIQALTGPGVASGNLNKVEEVDSILEDREAKKISQAAAEFGALTRVVLRELSGMRGSFLSVRAAGDYDNINLKVKPSKVAFPTVLDLVSNMEGARDAGEAAIEGHVLDLQTQFVRRLNEMVARSC